MVDDQVKARRRRGRKGESPSEIKRKHGPSKHSTVTTHKASATVRAHKSLLIHNSDESWFRCSSNVPERNAVGQAPLHLVQKYRAMGDALYRNEVQIFSGSSKSESNNKDDRWIESTMRKGTLKDRIAAMSVLVSTDPVHKFYALDGLLQMTGCSLEPGGPPSTPNSRVAQLAAEALEDLFLHTFLPSDRRLLTLAQRPLDQYEKTDSNNKKTLSPRILLLWRFEEMVQAKYDLFLRQYLAHTLQEGNMELQKIAAVRSAATLLRSVPEGETVLLSCLVNKLGDPGKKICAAAGHELRQVTLQHPAMTPIVCREVQQLAHRPRLGASALYHCVTFLNQIKLTRPTRAEILKAKEAWTNRKKKKSDSTVRPDVPQTLAASLISTYFRLFEVATQAPASAKHKKVKSSKSASSSSSSPSTATTPPGMQSRLLSALLTGVNRAHPFLPSSDPVMEDHVDALYRVVHTAPPGARTQSLLLLFHWAVATTEQQSRDGGDADVDDSSSSPKKARRERFYRALYSTVSNTDMLGAGKHLTMFFNLLYKAMKYDTDTSRIVAFAKRILATTLHCSSAVTAASIFLLAEVGQEHPVLLTCFTDVLHGPDAVRILDPTKREPRGALVSAQDGKFAHEDDEKKAPGWELVLARHHFHPSVQAFANNIGGSGSTDRDGNPTTQSYSGDPLKDFALAPFLDKFAYRNPKSVDRVAGKYKRDQSIAERRSGTDSVIQSQFALPVNDPSFAQQDAVPTQDEFFHKFFTERAKRDKIKGIERHSTDPNREEDGPQNRREAELDALHKIEAGDADLAPKYEDFEAAWGDEDEEEEAFVDMLAQKIIEDTMDINGPADLDDEDPDMDDWGDLHEDSEELKNKDEVSDEDDEADENEEQDDDAFMDDDDSEDSSNGEEELDDTVFANMVDSGADDSSDAGNDDDLAFAGDGDSSDDEVPPLVRLPHGGGDTFAAAEDYEELISKSWNKQQKRNHEDAHDDSSRREKSAKTSKKKKRRK